MLRRPQDTAMAKTLVTKAKAKANNAGIKTTAFSTRRVFFQKKCSTK